MWDFWNSSLGEFMSNVQIICSQDKRQMRQKLVNEQQKLVNVQQKILGELMKLEDEELQKLQLKAQAAQV